MALDATHRLVDSIPMLCRVRWLAALVVLSAGLVWPVRAAAQGVDPNATPVLQPLSPDEYAALRPLAEHGIAVLVRDFTAGVRARTTVLLRSHAPLVTVHDVIAHPERYNDFVHAIDRMDILSRRDAFLSFRMHTAVTIFSVDTVANMHFIGERRVDGQLLESQLGPGGFRWDLYSEGPDTFIAYSTWGDPTEGNWFLRQIARLDPGAIAGMQLSYNANLALMVARRAENLTGAHRPDASGHAAGPPASIEPPAAGPWLTLTRSGVIVGAIELDDEGATTRASVAAWVGTAADVVCARLADPNQYRHWWDSIHQLEVQPAQGNTQRFRTRIESTLFATQGEQDRVLDLSPGHATIIWRGVSGDYVNDVQRWDLSRAEGGGTYVVFSGGPDYNRTGVVMRALVDRVPWMLPGYAAAWKMVWMRPLLAGM